MHEIMLSVPTATADMHTHLLCAAIPHTAFNRKTPPASDTSMCLDGHSIIHDQDTLLIFDCSAGSNALLNRSNIERLSRDDRLVVE